ncbi:hypothetical protein AQUCO_02800106v1 [Aquilegia coerulea]|uniref:Uncharacterized protein n=1 Tax=Aquilegia coerulea TaxID=218851 RepID=A0A2G5D3Y6_AQUCA|nr:hypothetical protein AQUCO_02800106v1 [Aquilegia coerulea]
MVGSDFLNFTVYGIIFAISAVAVIIWRSRRRVRLPPSPLALPIIGHLHLLGPILHQNFYKLSNQYGPLIYLLLGSVPCVIASTAETAKEFLKTHELAFSGRPFLDAVDYITYGTADFTFAQYGPYWRFMRKLCTSELLNGRTLDQLYYVRREEIRRFLAVMLQKSDAEETVSVSGELLTLMNNIISRMMMSKRSSESENETAEIRILVNEVAEISGTLNLSDCIWFCRYFDLQGIKKRTEDVHVRLDAIIEKIIKDQRELRNQNSEGGRVKHLLDILLDVAEDDNAEFQLTCENIKSFILDVFVAGSDTSAKTTEWALAELINHPDIFEKAREEIDSVIGKNRLVEESDIQNLPYLQAIVKETLRLHSTGPLLVRRASEDCKVGEYDIPKNTRLFVNVWAIGRDAEHWENPLEFRPNRFITEEGSLKSQLDVRGHQYQLLPFGSGRRGCPGISLALRSVQTTLASIIQCFEFKVGDGKGATLDMTEGPGLTLPRAHPLVCVPVARLNILPLL